jgi:hypothetical protein
LADVLPSFLGIRNYVRPSMRARHSHNALLVPDFEHMSLAQQQQACSRLLKKLGQRYLDRRSLVPGSRPFSKQYTLVTRTETLVEGAEPEVEYHPLRFGLQQRRQTIIVVHTKTPACMPHTATKSWQVPYLRVQLVGRRSGRRCPVNEYAHRVVCWMAHGPPSSDVSLLNQPELGRWHRTNWVVGHLCGNARCLCPQHLAWLRPQDNRECETWHARHGHGAGHLWPGPGG